MAVTAETFQEKFPEFAGETEARVDLFLADARNEVSESDWGKDADNAVMLFAAHLLCTVGNPNGSSAVAPGAVKSEKIGEVAAEYAVATPSGSDAQSVLQSTPYGQEFLRLKQRQFPRRYATSKEGL